MSREVPWNWYAPGPARKEARARQRRRVEQAAEATRARARAEGRALTRADRDADIRRLRADGWTGVELAGRFGLAESTVSRICEGMPSRRRYGDPEDVTFPYPRRRAEAPGAPAVPPRAVPPASGETLPPISNRRIGSASGRAVLTEAEVIEMRRLRSEGWSTGRLAGRYSVGRNTICYALDGRTWGHVPGAVPAKGGTS